MIRRPPRSTQGVSSAASDVYKRQPEGRAELHRFIGQVIEHGWNLVIETPEGVRGIPADQVIQWWIDHGQTVDPLSIAYIERPERGRD